MVNGKDLAGGITGWSVKKVKDNVHDTFETRGKYPSASVHFNEYVVSGDNSGLRLRARVFNNGVAFRYEWTEDVQKAPVLNIGEEKTSFAFPEKAVLWTQDAASALGPCEGVWSPSRIADFKKDPGNPRSHVRTMPVAAELPGGGFALIQEAANFNRQWSGIKFSLQDGACRTVYFQDPEGFSAPSSAEMPWRVILVNDDLNGLVRNDVIPSLAPEPDKNLFRKEPKRPGSSRAAPPGPGGTAETSVKRTSTPLSTWPPNSAGNTTSLTKDGRNGAKPCRKAWTRWLNWPATPPANK